MQMDSKIKKMQSNRESKVISTTTLSRDTLSLLQTLKSIFLPQQHPFDMQVHAQVVVSTLLCVTTTQIEMENKVHLMMDVISVWASHDKMFLVIPLLCIRVRTLVSSDFLVKQTNI